MTRSLQISASLALCLLALPAYAAQFEVKQTDEGVDVLLDGELFTRYLTKSNTKPILWPIHGPRGEEMTRAYPMVEGREHEREDHPHQRSFWFTHGDVNGISFWHEQGNHGTIEHKEFVKVEGGPEAVIVTRNDWLAPDGKELCSDVRTITFGTDGETRWIDFDVTVTAGDEPVTFGDTKEGSFGVRVAGTMKVEEKLGGHIVNSDGLMDTEAWGKRAPWVDYYGPVQGKTSGIAILNHPSSYRFPTYWHVRTYGLFAANPWGVRDFTGNAEQLGSDTFAPGKSFTLRYRVLFHKGDAKEAKVAEAFAKYSAEQ